jgi:hypothetical protein
MKCKNILSPFKKKMFKFRLFRKKSSQQIRAGVVPVVIYTKEDI